MRRAIPVVAVVAAALLGAPSVARASGADEVRVAGRTFRGTVIESRPDVLVRVRLDDGSVMTVPWSDVLAVHRGADGPVPAETEIEEAPRTRWYGWQTLLVDAGSLLLIPAGGAGFVTYAVGPPVVHAIHGQEGRAMGSLFLRLGLPAVCAAGLAYVFDHAVTTQTPPGRVDNGPPASFAGVILGGVAGAIAAVSIDAAVLAREPVKASPAKRGSAPHFTVVPMIATPGGPEHGYTPGLGIAGTF